MSRLPILNSSAAPPADRERTLPTVEALDRLWQTVSAKPLWVPSRLARYLKLRRQTDLKLLDPKTISISAPKGKINDCGACTDICCIGPRSTVLLRFKDIATLMDIEKTHLMTQAKPQFSADELRARPALQRQVHSSSWEMFPVLQQNSFGACVALTDAGKCSLYPHWPLSCARFPYALHVDDREVFYSSRCDAFWIRPDVDDRIEAMKVAAVAAYNERIKDLVLLAYAKDELQALGLLDHLNLTP